MKLEEPGRIGSLEVKNRIVMAAKRSCPWTVSCMQAD